MFLSVKNELYIFWCIKESRVDCSKDEPTVWRYKKEGWEEGGVENGEFAVKDLPLGRTLWLIDWVHLANIDLLSALLDEYF